MALTPIDLHHQGVERVIGVYPVETDDGLALFDCGPTTGLEALERGLAERGLGLADIRHLLLSHIHLDHAGAAGVIVRQHPAIRVHVSPVGAPHLVDPSRLERSARRIWGDEFDTLWGELAPVPAGNVESVGSRVVGLECFPTRGHAEHHVSYVGRDGTLYAGDAAGVRIMPGRYIVPASPPPELDLESWLATIDELERRSPERLALIHFGIVDDTADHLRRLRDQLQLWAERVRDGATPEEFLAAARRDLELTDPGSTTPYANAAPVWQSYAGLQRYWQKRAAA